MGLTTAAAWEALAALPRPTLIALFANDVGRLDRFTGRIDLAGGGGLRFDWSKTHLDDAVCDLFFRLVETTGFVERRAALFAGDVVNLTEDRAAEHTAERGLGSADAVARSAALHSRMAALVSAIHGGAFGPIRHLIHIGIGGSALGPALAIGGFMMASKAEEALTEAKEYKAEVAVAVAGGAVLAAAWLANG